MKHQFVMILIFGMLGAGSAQASVIHDEVLNGDLSDFEEIPTSLPALAAGSNEVLGSLIGWRSGVGDYRDAFTFTVGSGQFVASIELLDYTVNVQGENSRFNLYSGNVGNGSAGTFIGSADVDASNIGDNMLEIIVPSSAELTPGEYSILINEFTNVVEVGYHFSLEVIAAAAAANQVTAPATLPLVLLGMLLPAWAARPSRTTSARRTSMS